MNINEGEIKLLPIETYNPSASVDYYKIENEKGNGFGHFAYIPHYEVLERFNLMMWRLYPGINSIEKELIELTGTLFLAKKH